MKNLPSVIAALLLAVVVSACEPQSAAGGVAIIDLATVAKATGQEETMRVESEAARAELTSQLQQLAQNLEGQLAAEREKAGISPNQEQQARLQQLGLAAQQQVNNAQQQAQAQANAFEQQLVTDFRAEIRPLAEQIARDKGLSVVLAADAYLFWFDPAVDITDEVIAGYRAGAQESAPAETEAAEQVDFEEAADAPAEPEAQSAEEAAATGVSEGASD